MSASRSNEMSASRRLMRSAAVSLGLFALAGTTTVYAADMVNEQPPTAPAAPIEAAPVPTWEGLYAGVTLGYGFSGRTNTPGNEIDSDGLVGGGFAGWLGQSDSFVYGVEGDVNYNGMDGSNAGQSVDHGIDGSLRARLGFAASDSLLIYGTGGGAAENLEVTNAAGTSETNTMLGWTVGAGVDAKLTDNIFSRLEYRYTDYRSETFNNVGGSVDDSNHRVLVGVGMQF